MNKSSTYTLQQIVDLLKDILYKPQLPANRQLIADLDPELALLLEQFIKLREFSHSLATGDLHQMLDMRGYYAGSLKALQANLRHLTWQTDMVAHGDYSQRVDFMGEFSRAFNQMIRRLKDAADQERKYKLLAENTDDVIWLFDGEMRLQYISPSINKLMDFAPEEYDNLHGTSLTETLEKILSGMSLKEIAAETFFHYKTIQLRKHRIEQILNISLDSHETKMALSAAVQLRKILGT